MNSGNRGRIKTRYLAGLLILLIMAGPLLLILSANRHKRPASRNDAIPAAANSTTALTSGVIVRTNITMFGVTATNYSALLREILALRSRDIRNTNIGVGAIKSAVVYALMNRPECIAF